MYTLSRLRHKTLEIQLKCLRFLSLITFSRLLYRGSYYTVCFFIITMHLFVVLLHISNIYVFLLLFSC